ncbi:hypothetical protein [Flavobacterium sp. NRK F7]|uniref:hypothetical protein n=1 Tax=Flavobacterium sp. NRK F7 TaxID=2954930 RepID=UPI0027E364A7|nr:hypothetical protein [Flavobacterium sp. NRK F7]
MMPFEEIELTVNTFHKLGLTVEAAQFLIETYHLNHPNFDSFELMEVAQPSFIVMVTIGVLGQPQKIQIPKNVFEFPLVLILNLLAHEMLHVRQKAPDSLVEDKNEREWQAYYEMLFHKEFPLIPMVSNFNLKDFANKGLEYYRRMGENSYLQEKYAPQKEEVEQFLLQLH